MVDWLFTAGAEYLKNPKLWKNNMHERFAQCNVCGKIHTGKGETAQEASLAASRRKIECEAQNAKPYHFIPGGFYEFPAGFLKRRMVIHILRVSLREGDHEPIIHFQYWDQDRQLYAYSKIRRQLDKKLMSRSHARLSMRR